MSGGVDSAVAALLLKRAGFDVQGLYMSNWDDDDAYCTGAQDFQDARASAAELGIPLHRVSFAAAYRARVFDYFLREYQAGRTPNAQKPYAHISAIHSQSFCPSRTRNGARPDVPDVVW